MIARQGSGTFAQMPEPTKYILVAVLDWGLGHATRCVPLIKSLLDRGCNVSLAGSGDSLLLLKQEFPHLQAFEIVSYKVAYAETIPFMVKIFMQLPKFLAAIKNEHQQIERLCLEKKMDAIISDNRYGCWSNSIPSVLITHQLNLLLPPAFKWLNGFVNSLNHKLIKKFDTCWVPDYPGNTLTRALTKPGNLRVSFIGMLSRMKPGEIAPTENTILAIVSGPEPQRQILEDILVVEMSGRGEACILVRGQPGVRTNLQRDGLTIYDHLPGERLSELIQQSSLVIARSGYSTIMDFARIGVKKVILIPTPGQTEQEYLARELDKQKIALCQAQADFDLTDALSRLSDYNGFNEKEAEPGLLAKALEDLLQMKKHGL